jgi:hypothetical protein
LTSWLEFFSGRIQFGNQDAGEDHQKLRIIAKKLLDKAAKGDMQAINCLADRLDGKPSQAVEVSGDTTRYVIRAPLPNATSEEWEQEHFPARNAG